MDLPTIKTAVATFIREEREKQSAGLTAEQRQAIENAQERIREGGKLTDDEVARLPNPFDQFADVSPEEEAAAVIGDYEPKRALTTYLVFPSWALLVETLTAGKPPPAVFDG